MLSNNLVSKLLDVHGFCPFHSLDFIVFLVCFLFFLFSFVFTCPSPISILQWVSFVISLYNISPTDSNIRST